jgi:hypothetical protein
VTEREIDELVDWRRPAGLRQSRGAAIVQVASAATNLAVIADRFAELRERSSATQRV